ncbi:MAG: hypothetical protein M1829_006409 [Trizodia sp. TS-e1964]|nr:MAG: hypothetical protein M1829_006409 [Trizodia sp. TS-e1964]
MPSKRLKTAQTIIINDDSEEETKPSFNGKLETFAFSSDLTAIEPANTTITPCPTSSRKRNSSGDETNSSKEPSSSSSSPTSSSPKKARAKAGYAPPSKYAHLSFLPDSLAPNLICMFVGSNAGVKSASVGHCYSHPSNRFWPTLFSSGCTPRLCRAVEDQELPRLYSLGNTNLVDRPSKEESELSKDERQAGVGPLEDKIRKFQPEAVCIVGKSNWEVIWRVKHGRRLKKTEFKYGWQDDILGMKLQGNDSYLKEEVEDGLSTSYPGARVFVASSTSGLAVSPPKAEKEAIWKVLGDWVKLRRAERDGLKPLI